MKYLLILIFIPSLLFAQTAKVTRVIDGDTFEIENGERVRVVGIDAPEIMDIYGPEAKQHLQMLIEGKIVNLHTDHISKDRDRYSRLLRYVYLNDTDIDKKMLLDGYAVAYLKFRFDKPDEYKQAQLFAQSNSLGMWHYPGDRIKIAISKNESKLAIFKQFTPKAYLLVVLLLTLVVIGAYSYFRK